MAYLLRTYYKIIKLKKLPERLFRNINKGNLQKGTDCYNTKSEVNRVINIHLF